MMLMQLELGIWSDGSVRLAHWDAMHGDDRIFVLYEDGAVLESKYYDDDEEFAPVDLIAELRKMALAQKEEEDGEENEEMD